MTYTLKGEISGIIAISPSGGKEARAAAVQPQIESGNVYLPDGAAWLDPFVEEFATFPRGRHDDQVDALTQALADLGHRLRTLQLKQWKRGTTIYRELIARGMSDLTARRVAANARRWCSNARMSIHIALPNAYFDALGVPRLAA